MKLVIDSPPTFIVGCGHSGTWLLLAILGTHSRIYAIPMETEVFIKTARADIETTLKQLDQLALSADRCRWVEKTPKHINRIEVIFNFCPDAKIIILIRDGRDVACSIKERYPPYRFDRGIVMGATRWVDDNLAGQKYWDHPNVKVVKYEDIVSDFEKTITGVLHFMGEIYEPQVRDFHTIERRWGSSKIEEPKTRYGTDHSQYRNWQINQPLFDGRVRWKKLSYIDLRMVTDIESDMLFKLGYTGG